MSTIDPRPCRILIVDDSAYDRAEAKAALLHGSYRRWEFLEAENGAQALRMCDMKPAPDCMVLDFDLPDATALQVLERMARGDDDLIRIPVVILTSAVSATLNQTVLRAGAQDYVGKSWLGPESLTRAVENAMERHAMTFELRRDRTRQQVVAEVAQAAAAGGSSQALKLLLEKIRLLVRADMFMVYAVDSGNHLQLRLQTSAGLSAADSERLAVIPLEPSSWDDNALGVRASASSSLTVDGRVYGTLIFGSNARCKFDPCDVDFIALVGRQIGPAWQRLELLRAKEHELRTLTDHSPDILSRHDRALRCVFINDAITRTTGLLPSDCIGKTNHEIGMSSRLRATWDKAILQVFNTGEPHTFEVKFKKSGQTRYFECCLIAECVNPGMREHVMGISHDVTERRQHAQRREHLLQAERAARVEGERAGLIKDEFLATVTHELRTPLASIISWSNLLKLSLHNEDMVRRCLDVIVVSAREQAALVADLLDMNRIVSGKMRMESELVDIDLVALTAVDTLSLTVAAKGIALSISLNCGPTVRIRGDAGRLRQVLWNLLTNAVKFTPSSGTITIGTSVVGQNVAVVITDSGSGIDAAYLPFLFDRFSQADSSRARTHGGLGLGLSIVKSLVECHGGTVAGSSAGLGQGASFTLLFPLAEPGDSAFTRLAAPAETPAPLAQESGVKFRTAQRGVLHGVSILLVDDLAGMRAVLQSLLSDAGAIVRTAGSAQEALEQIAVSVPDVLLSDIGMPGKDGYQLLEEIRREIGLTAEQLPAAAVTAYTRPQDHLRALRSGYQACIGKPVDEQLLIRTVLALQEKKISK